MTGTRTIRDNNGNVIMDLDAQNMEAYRYTFDVACGDEHDQIIVTAPIPNGNDLDVFREQMTKSATEAATRAARGRWGDVPVSLALVAGPVLMTDFSDQRETA